MISMPFFGEDESNETTIMRNPRFRCIVNLNGHIGTAIGLSIYTLGSFVLPSRFSDILKSAWGMAPQEAKTVQTTYGEQHPHRGNPFAWAVLAVVLVAVLAFFAILAIHGYPSVLAGSYYGYPFFGWWFFFPFGILFIFIIILFVGRLVFWPMGWGWRRRYWYGYGYGDANEILRQRYARGEITKEQYEQMKRDLGQH